MLREVNNSPKTGQLLSDGAEIQPWLLLFHSLCCQSRALLLFPGSSHANSSAGIFPLNDLQCSAQNDSKHVLLFVRIPSDHFSLPCQNLHVQASILIRLCSLIFNVRHNFYISTSELKYRCLVTIYHSHILNSLFKNFQLHHYVLTIEFFPLPHTSLALRLDFMFLTSHTVFFLFFFQPAHTPQLCSPPLQSLC